MSDERIMTAHVDVTVDAVTAFQIFTKEMGRWWVPGPINFFDSSRALGMVCEAGIGGRLIESYDAATGEGLEVGRIKVWEPGECLAWDSSVDDVEVTVRFLPIEGGTRVVVEAVLPDDGSDQGGSSWVRVAPSWFGALCARWDETPNGGHSLSRLALTIRYEEPLFAARWIKQVLALEPILPLPDEVEAGEGWFEFRVGDGLLVVLGMTGPFSSDRTPTHVPWIFVDDLDIHFANASAAGATILDDIYHYGYRGYDVEDLEGNRWTIVQTLPSVHRKF